MLLACLVEQRRTRPFVDRGLSPTDTALADPNLRRERALLDPTIERRATEAGLLENGIEAHKAVGGVDLHDVQSCSYWYGLAPNANRIGRDNLAVKSLRYLRKCSSDPVRSIEVYRWLETANRRVQIFRPTRCLRRLEMAVSLNRPESVSICCRVASSEARIPTPVNDGRSSQMLGSGVSLHDRLGRT